MPLQPPPVARNTFRFALPPSVGVEQARERASRLEFFLQKAVGRRSEVLVAKDYESLAKDILSSKIDAAWAPPYVCARLEAMGVPVRLRGIRNGHASYRSALLCRQGENLTLETLSGKKVAWVDRDSVGGYLLPIAFLKERRIEPSQIFFTQSFLGSYQAALESVLKGTHDVTSVFAPLPEVGSDTGIDQVLPGQKDRFQVIAFTDESPNDGVVMALGIGVEASAALEKSFLELKESAAGQGILSEIFNAERFEPAPRLGYRALYRVALATL
jgi:phosphonate transport system substrate-binding protein